MLVKSQPALTIRPEDYQLYEQIGTIIHDYDLGIDKDQLLAYVFHTMKNHPYHGYNHILSMFKSFAAIPKGVLAHPEAVIWFILFHDIFYDPRGNNNERTSGYMLLDYHGKQRYDQANIAVQYALTGIDLSASYHEDNNYDEMVVEIRLMRDLDLEIFSASEEEFRAYRANIELEYEHVPTEVFIDKSIEFFRTMLAKKIYVSPFVGHAAEDSAKVNIMRELGRLHQRKLDIQYDYTNPIILDI